MKKIYYIPVLIVLSFSCKKVQNCLESIGNEVVLESFIDEFDTLSVNDEFIVYLIQDTVNQIRIEGYETFVNSTTFEIKNNTLILRNEHRCKFSKPKSKTIKVFIKINEISKIHLNASSKIIAETELTNADEIGLIISSKYNEADLQLNCKTFYYWNTHLNGGKVNLKGQVENLKLWNTSLGSVNAENLSANNVLIDTDSKADCKIKVKRKLDCTISGQGNVYYSGNPELVIVNDTSSTGRLIHSNK